MMPNMMKSYKNLLTNWMSRWLYSTNHKEAWTLNLINMSKWYLMKMIYVVSFSMLFMSELMKVHSSNKGKKEMVSTNYNLDSFFIMFFFNCLLLLLRLKKMLMILFAFEFLMVNLMFAFMQMSMPYDPIPLLVFLAVAVGEASLGLTLLMSMIRQSGKDNMSAPSLLNNSEGF